MEQLFGEDEEDTELLKTLANRAELYISSKSWCRGIRERYFGDGIGGIAAVFLFRIEPSAPHVDEWLWVIVGDIPPAYLVLDEARLQSEALAHYIREMRQWVSLAMTGSYSTKVISVSADPTPANGRRLALRLDLLSELLIPRFEANEALHS